MLSVQVDDLNESESTENGSFNCKSKIEQLASKNYMYLVNNEECDQTIDSTNFTETIDTPNSKETIDNKKSSKLSLTKNEYLY